MIDTVNAAQQIQHQNLLAALQEARLGREQYIRLCVCLMRALQGEAEVLIASDHVAVPREQYEAVPHQFKIQATQAQVEVQAEEEDGEVEEMDVFILRLEKQVQNGNGTLAVPETPRILRP